MLISFILFLETGRYSYPKVSSKTLRVGSMSESTVVVCMEQTKVRCSDFKGCRNVEGLLNLLRHSLIRKLYVSSCVAMSYVRLVIRLTVIQIFHVARLECC